MKRTILAVLMFVMIVTPCFAQEIEPDGLFSIEGTRWGYCWIELGIGCGAFFCLPFVRGGCDEIAFYQGTGYWCSKDINRCGINSRLTYIDSPLVSIVSDVWTPGNSRHAKFAIMQPTGFGVYIGFDWQSPQMPRIGAALSYSIGIMFKIEDDWSPYDQPIWCNPSYSGICPEGMVCVDDPSDDCDPTLDDRNPLPCPGLCVNE